MGGGAGGGLTRFVTLNAAQLYLVDCRGVAMVACVLEHDFHYLRTLFDFG